MWPCWGTSRPDTERCGGEEDVWIGLVLASHELHQEEEEEEEPLHSRFASVAMTSIVTARINYWEKLPQGHVVFNIDVRVACQSNLPRHLVCCVCVCVDYIIQ